MYPITTSTRTSAGWEAVKPNKTMGFIIIAIVVFIFVWVRIEDNVPPTYITATTPAMVAAKLNHPNKSLINIQHQIDHQQQIHSPAHTNPPQSNTHEVQPIMPVPIPTPAPQPVETEPQPTPSTADSEIIGADS